MYRYAFTLLFWITLILCPFCARSQVTLPWHEGFEKVGTSVLSSSTTSISGLTGAEYQTSNSGELRFNAGIGQYKTGTRSATFEEPSSGTSRSYLILTTDLRNYTKAKLELGFWYLDGNTKSDTANRVWIRGSKTSSWIKIFDLDTTRISPWQKVDGIDINSILSANNQKVSSTFQMRFGQAISESSTFSPDFTIDDITIRQSIGNDAALSKLESYCVGTSPVRIPIENRGNNVISSGRISWSVNGTKKNSVLFKASIPKGGSKTITLGSHGFAQGKADTFNVTIDSINGTVDSVSHNSSLKNYITKPNTMHGVYTIGGTGADFSTFRKAIDTLTANGVCGPVTLRIRAGTYYGQVEMGEIAGASEWNTIRFVGASTKSVVLTHSANSSSNAPTILLDGADHIILDSLTIVARGRNHGVGVWIADGADNNAIMNSVISFTTATISNSHAGVVVSGANRQMSATQRDINRFTFYGNEIIRGYYGLRVTGYRSENPAQTNFIIEKNKFSQLEGYGIHYRECKGMAILSNEMDSFTNATAVGIYSYNNVADSIIGNKVVAPKAGIHLFGSNYWWAYDTSFVVNNMVAGQTTSSGNALYGRKVVRVQMLGNSMENANSSNNSGATLYMYESGICRFENNTFSNLNGGYVFSLDGTCAPGWIQHNNYYNFNSGGTMIYYGRKWYKDLSTWKKNVTIQNSGSISNDPEFYSTRNLYTESLNLNNSGRRLPRFNYDIDGEKRPIKGDTKFDIGADDYYIPPYDADIVSILTPHLQAGANTISITIDNNGPKTWKNDTIFVEYTIDSSAASKDTIVTGTVEPDSSLIFDFSVPYVLKGNGQFRNVCATFSKQFKGSDPDTLQERVCDSICAELPGSLITVGKVGANFTSLSAAIDHLHCAGISQSVIIRVDTGVFRDQVKIGPIRGTSKSNTIRIVGHGSRTVITHDGTNGGHTVELDSAKHMIFDSLTMECTSNGAGTVVYFTNGADSNVVENSTLRALPSIKNLGNIVVASGPWNNKNVTNANYNALRNNLILGGWYGVYWSGSTSGVPDKGNSLLNNTFKGQYNYGIYTRSNSHQKIVGNEIDSTLSGSAHGVYSTNCKGDSIASNKVIVDGDGLYLTSMDSSYVVNNMISGASYSQSHSIYARGVHNTHLVGNSIWNINKNTSYYYASAFEIYSCSHLVVRNNSVYREYDGFALYVRHSYPGKLDHNNYYAPNSKDFIHYWGAYSDVATYSRIKRQDSHSISVPPGYYGLKDLRTNSVRLNNKGSNMKDFAADFYGNPRPAKGDQTFDIGAYEYYLPSYDADIVAIGPTVLKNGDNTITVRLKNNGVTAWSKDNIHLEYSIDSGAVVKETFVTGNVKPGNSVTYSFKTPFKLKTNPIGKPLNICVAINKQFKNEDPDSLNDRSCQLTCVDHKRTLITVGKNGQDFETVSGAITYLECVGVANPVTIRLAKGIYREQVNIPAISGVSKSNTIRMVGVGTGSVISFDASEGHHTLKLDGAVYFTFDSLSIETTSDSNGRAIFLTNNADFNTFTNCTIKASTSTTLTTNAAVVASASETTLYSGNNANYNVFSNNNVIGGYYGVVFLGASTTGPIEGNEFTKNHFSRQYHYGVYFRNVKGTLFEENVLDSASHSAGVAFYSRYGADNNVILNKISAPWQGIYCGYENSFKGSASLVANNTIKLFGTISDQKGIYAQYNKGVSYLHNSILITNTSSKNTAATFFKCENGVVANNIFMNNGSGLAIDESGSKYLSGNFDHNNYYAPNSSVVANINGSKSTLQAIKTADASQNQNSVSLNPHFTSTIDFHAGAAGLLNAGGNFGIDVDFDGDKRASTNPDIGADEIWKDLEIGQVLKPLNGCRMAGDKDTVVISFKNNGRSSFTENDLVLLEVNLGSNIYTDTLKIPKGAVLLPAQGLTIPLSRQLTSAGTGWQKISIKSSYPRDSSLSNDTTSHRFHSYPAPKAGFATNPTCLGDVMKFTNTSSNATSYTWNLGDGNSINTASPQHKYANSGTYTVSLIAETNYGCSDTSRKQVVVHQLPTAKFSVHSGCLGDTMRFVNDSKDGIRYHWDFGDGVSDTIESPQYIYPNAGSYDAVLEVFSQKKCSHKDTVSVTVSPIPSKPNWGFSKIDGFKHNFLVSGQIDPSNSYSWSFGNGDTGTGADVDYTFDTAGTYLVTCVVTSSAKCSNVFSQEVEVKPISIAEIEGLFALKAYPNPFIDRVTFAYSLRKKANVVLEIVDIHGRPVLPLVSENQTAGAYSYEVVPERLPSGMFLLRISIDGQMSYVNVIKSR